MKGKSGNVLKAYQADGLENICHDLKSDKLDRDISTDKPSSAHCYHPNIVTAPIICADWL